MLDVADAESADMASLVGEAKAFVKADGAEVVGADAQGDAFDAPFLRFVKQRDAQRPADAAAGTGDENDGGQDVVSRDGRTKLAR